MGWTLWGSNLGGGETFRTRPGKPWGPPSLLYNGYRVFPGVKRQERGVDHLPYLQCRGLKNGTAIPLPTLRAVVTYKGGTFIFFNFTKRSNNGTKSEIRVTLAVTDQIYGSGCFLKSCHTHNTRVFGDVRDEPKCSGTHTEQS